MEKKHAVKSAGYDLYEIYPNHWMLHDKSDMRVYNGSLIEVGKLAVQNLHFDIDEIEFAVTEMNKHGHNGAHFGMSTGFIFSFNRNFDAKKTG